MRSSSTSPSKTIVPGARIARDDRDAVVAQVAVQRVVRRARGSAAKRPSTSGAHSTRSGRDVVEPPEAGERRLRAPARRRPRRARRSSARVPGLAPHARPNAQARWRPESSTDARSQRSCATRSPRARSGCASAASRRGWSSRSSARTPASVAYVRSIEKVGRQSGRRRARRRAAGRRGRGRAARAAARARRRSARFTASSSNSRCRRTWAIRRIAEAMPPHKDVDGANPVNLGRLAFASGTEFVPGDAAGVHAAARAQRALAAARRARLRRRPLERRRPAGRAAADGARRDRHRSCTAGRATSRATRATPRCSSSATGVPGLIRARTWSRPARP